VLVGLSRSRLGGLRIPPVQTTRTTRTASRNSGAGETRTTQPTRTTRTANRNLGLKDRRSSRKTNRRKRRVKNIHRAIERYIQAKRGVSRLTNNRIKNIKDIEFINLHLIITECLSPKNIDLQESVLFYYLKHKDYNYYN
jgi:hypothetical protein